jgi:hypothetical protein
VQGVAARDAVPGCSLLPDWVSWRCWRASNCIPSKFHLVVRLPATLRIGLAGCRLLSGIYYEYRLGGHFVSSPNDVPPCRGGAWPRRVGRWAHRACRRQSARAGVASPNLGLGCSGEVVDGLHGVGRRGASDRGRSLTMKNRRYSRPQFSPFSFYAALFNMSLLQTYYCVHSKVRSIAPVAASGSGLAHVPRAGTPGCPPLLFSRRQLNQALTSFPRRSLPRGGRVHFPKLHAASS